MYHFNIIMITIFKKSLSCIFSQFSLKNAMRGIAKSFVE